MAQLVARSLSMGKVSGSNPDSSNFFPDLTLQKEIRPCALSIKFVASWEWQWHGAELQKNLSKRMLVHALPQPSRRRHTSTHLVCLPEFLKFLFSKRGNSIDPAWCIDKSNPLGYCRGGKAPTAKNPIQNDDHQKSGSSLDAARGCFFMPW